MNRHADPKSVSNENCSSSDLLIAHTRTYFVRHRRRENTNSNDGRGAFPLAAEKDSRKESGRILSLCPRFAYLEYLA